MDRLWKIAIGAWWISGFAAIVVVAVIFGWTVYQTMSGSSPKPAGAPGTDTPESTANLRRELLAVAPSALTATSPSVTTLGVLSGQSDLEREALAKSITGRVVQWTLPVSDVSLSGNFLVIRTEPEVGRATAICRVWKDANDIQKAQQLTPGDPVTCKGFISGADILGSISISPAVIVW